MSEAPKVPPVDKRALLRKAALEYHEFPKPGKIAIASTKQMVNQLDLSLAYSPGVAAPCEEIVKDPNAAFRYTSRGNLVGVITNGTAVLGLGDIGALASKPVMEGKAVLFKKFSGIDVFDIEINEKDPEKLVEIIAALEPTFGGINLEDIKAPDCFYVERKLRERMNIPVFHDDQHGTAIVTLAALENALKIVGKDIGDLKVVVAGVGAAGVVDVPVGQEDFFDVEPQLPYRIEDALQVTAGIDHGRLARDIAPKQRAILFEGRNGNNLVLEHGEGSVRPDTGFNDVLDTALAARY